MGMDWAQLRDLAVLSAVQFGGEMSELDDAGTYFDMPPVKARGVGTYSYLCTRNNNFSNRSQKGRIIVADAPGTSQWVGAPGGVLGLPVEAQWTGPVDTPEQIMATADYWMWIPENSLAGPAAVQMQVWAGEGMGMSDAASDVVEIGPANLVSSVKFD